MGDAHNNPDRVSDAGLRNKDLIALLSCQNLEDVICPAQSAVFFSVKDLRSSIDTSKLGPPKSASEGAERDRSWSFKVPKMGGQVTSVRDGKSKTLLDSGRNQTH